MKLNECEVVLTIMDISTLVGLIDQQVKALRRAEYRQDCYIDNINRFWQIKAKLEAQVNE